MELNNEQKHGSWHRTCYIYWIKCNFYFHSFSCGTSPSMNETTNWKIIYVFYRIEWILRQDVFSSYCSSMIGVQNTSTFKLRGAKHQGEKIETWWFSSLCCGATNLLTTGMLLHAFLNSNSDRSLQVFPRFFLLIYRMWSYQTTWLPIKWLIFKIYYTVWGCYVETRNPGFKSVLRQKFPRCFV